MEQTTAYNNHQRYRMLAFLAGFGAVGALGCDAVMQEEKVLLDLESEGENVDDAVAEVEAAPAAALSSVGLPETEKITEE